MQLGHFIYKIFTDIEVWATPGTPAIAIMYIIIINSS